MIVAKQVADLLTGFRVLLAFLFPAVGTVLGPGSLPIAIWMLIGCWTTDLFDGAFARRSSRQYHTWLGDHDLAVDITVSAGVLIYMFQTQFVSLSQAAVYTLAWGIVFWRFGVSRQLGMLVQAPIYAGFLWVGLTQSYDPAYWMVVWVVAVILLTWPRFPNEVIPGFLEGVGNMLRREAH